MKNVVFQEWAEEWLTYKKRYVKESTYANYLIWMRNHLIPAVGEEQVERVNSARIQEQISFWMEYGRRDGQGGLSEKTIKDMVMILKLCLRDYAKFQEENSPDFHVIYPGNQKEKRVEVLSQKQQGDLLDAIHQDGSYEALGYAMALYTGLRIGEICALKWENINMYERKIFVNKTIQRIYLKEGDGGKSKVIITTPKSEKSIRNIPVSDALYGLLREKVCDDKNIYFITGTCKYMEPRLYRKHYKKFLLQNKLEYIKFHGLRHTFATRCIEQGANYKVVSELLGHSSVKLTLDYYVHPQWEEKKRCVELI